MSRVKIISLSLRDCCYVAANIRQEDWDECRCQLDDENKFALANVCYFGTSEHLMWCAYLDNQPVTVFGIAKTGPTLGQVWLFSTRRVRRVFPTLLRFMDTEVRNAAIKDGLRRIEIRALETHEFVKKGWMNSIGAIDVMPLPQYGKNGEDFRLYAWWKGMPNERDVRSCYDRLRSHNPRITPGYESMVRRYQGGSASSHGNGRSLPELDVH